MPTASPATTVFFVQAEDGIRVPLVTGVQTCALPIYVDGALRSANRAGGYASVIAKARIAVITKAANAKAMLDAVPREAQRDAGYMFSRAQYLRRADEAADAADWILAVPADPGQTLDTDQWWIERRLVARKLLDLDDAKTAYRVVRDAA